MGAAGSDQERDNKGGAASQEGGKGSGRVKRGGGGGGGRGGGKEGFWASTALLQECLACNHTVGAERQESTICRSGEWAQTSTFNSLLWYCRQQRDPAGALTLLQTLNRSATVEADKTSFTLAIQACAWSGDKVAVEQAWEVVNEAESAGVPFNTKDILDAKMVLVQAVGGSIQAHLEDMNALGVPADEDTLISVINACAQRGDVQGALEMLDTMRRGSAAASGPAPR
ncbi:unnamed protein product, partial [Discosporangium mesarthrocarpum]